MQTWGSWLPWTRNTEKETKHALPIKTNKWVSLRVSLSNRPIPKNCLIPICGATPWKIGYGYVWSWRPPFHDLLAIPKTSISTFSVLKTLLSSPNHKFLEILSSKTSKISSKSSNWAKNQWTQGYILLRNSVH